MRIANNKERDEDLLPFDGICDWQNVASRLVNFNGPLTFELITHSKPDRRENDKHARMIATEYLAEAYSRACRVAALVQNARKVNGAHL